MNTVLLQKLHLFLNHFYSSHYTVGRSWLVYHCLSFFQLIPLFSLWSEFWRETRLPNRIFRFGWSGRTLQLDLGWLGWLWRCPKQWQFKRSRIQIRGHTWRASVQRFRRAWAPISVQSKNHLNRCGGFFRLVFVVRSISIAAILLFCLFGFAKEADRTAHVLDAPTPFTIRR